MMDGRELSRENRPGGKWFVRSPRTCFWATATAISGPRTPCKAVQTAREGSGPRRGLGRLEGLPAAAGWSHCPVPGRYGVVGCPV
jgi:hypothetical protein